MTEEDNVLRIIEADDLEEFLDLEDLDTVILSCPEDSNLNYFQYAVINNSIKIVTYLVQEYPDLFHFLDENGNTCVHLCVIDESCNIQLLQFFIDKFKVGILASKNFEGLQPLHYAVIHECYNGTKNMLELLRENGMEDLITNKDNIYLTSPEDFIKTDDELRNLFKFEDPKTKQIRILRTSLRDMENNFHAEKEKLEKENQNLQQQIGEKTNEIATINQNITKIQGEKENNENKLKQEIDEIKQENSRLLEANRRLETERNFLMNENQELRAEINSGCCNSSSKQSKQGSLSYHLIEDQNSCKTQKSKSNKRNGSYTAIPDTENPQNNNEEDGCSCCRIN